MSLTVIFAILALLSFLAAAFGANASLSGRAISFVPLGYAFLVLAWLL